MQNRLLSPRSALGLIPTLLTQTPSSAAALGLTTRNLLIPAPEPALGLARFALGSATGLAIPAPPPQWLFVSSRFTQFLDNLKLTILQNSDGNTKQAGVRSCLNRYFYGESSETANSLLIGSWGKYTRVRPPRDIDILFLLPAEVYHRYQNRTGNKQSQLLQEVKNVLAQTYSQTRIKGDGQVVVVPFSTMPVEVAPGFRCTDGSIIVCDANNQGSYVTSSAEIEVADLIISDSNYNGNTRALIRMMKAWQTEKNVPLKSFVLERLSIEFMASWGSNTKDTFWYDWMCRDFFAYLCSRVNGYITMPESGELIALGNDWLFKAQTAHKKAISACENEHQNYEYLAGSDWQDIFGNNIPMGVS